MSDVSSARPPLIVAAIVAMLAVVTAGLFALWPAGSAAHVGQWLEFPGPGTGYVDVPDAPELRPDQITIEAWVYLESYGGFGADGLCPTILGKDRTMSYWLGFTCAGGYLSFYSHGPGSQQVSDAAVPLHEWTNIAVTYDGAMSTFYINGEAAGAGTQVSGPLGHSSADVQIGHDVAWDASPFGYMDEVSIWNAARTQTEVQSDLTQQIIFPTPRLVAWWTFDHGAIDPAGGHPGTPHGDIRFEATEPTSSPSPTPTAPAVPKGDMNCDGQVNAVDALIILRHDAALINDLPHGCPPLGP